MPLGIREGSHWRLLPQAPSCEKTASRTSVIGRPDRIIQNFFYKFCNRQDLQSQRGLRGPLNTVGLHAVEKGAGSRGGLRGMHLKDAFETHSELLNGG
jgi:hypothetical protein